MLKKLLIKWFMPSPEDVAKTIAKATADFVNTSGKEDAIVNVISKTEKFEKVQTLVNKWLKDGKLDDVEVKELEEKLTPLCKLVIDKIMGKVA